VLSVSHAMIRHVVRVMFVTLCDVMLYFIMLSDKMLCHLREEDTLTVEKIQFK
jgi:hypothetical protein